MNKKKDPRTEYIIFRVTKQEKQNLREDATDNCMDTSEYIRFKLNLKSTKND